MIKFVITWHSFIKKKKNGGLKYGLDKPIAFLRGVGLMSECISLSKLTIRTINTIWKLHFILKARSIIE